MPEADKHTREIELVAAIKLSDNTAFKALCQTYYEPLYRFLWRKTRNETTAMDLVQDLFLAVWKQRERLDETRSIKAYLYCSANNLAINHLKKKALKQSYFVEDVPVEQISQTETSRKFQEYVDDVLQDLPEAQRTVFMLNKFDGLKYAEIAEVLDISIKTVESRMSKTLKTLREKLRHLLVLIYFFYF